MARRRLFWGVRVVCCVAASAVLLAVGWTRLAIAAAGLGLVIWSRDPATKGVTRE